MLLFCLFNREIYSQGSKKQLMLLLVSYFQSFYGDFYYSDFYYLVFSLLGQTVFLLGRTVCAKTGVFSMYPEAVCSVVCKWCSAGPEFMSTAIIIIPNLIPNVIDVCSMCWGCNFNFHFLSLEYIHYQIFFFFIIPVVFLPSSLHELFKNRFS